MSHWASRLRGTRVPAAKLEWPGIDADRAGSRLGAGAVEWAVETGDRMAAAMVARVRALDAEGDLYDLLRQATTSTTLRLLVEIAGLNDGGTVTAPEPLETVRDLARRGVKLTDVLRGIRIGYSVLAEELLAAPAQLLPDAAATTEIHRISLLLFDQVDDFTSVCTEEFLAEQANRAASMSAARLELVKKIVEGVDVDMAHAQHVLDEYPLSAQHLAIIAWSDASAGPHEPDLRAVVGRWRPAPLATLFIPVGSHIMWGWGALRSESADPPVISVPVAPGTHLAYGQIGLGVQGFRQSHREARAVERLMRLRDGRSPASPTAYEDVDLDVLLMSDVVAARSFVERHLGLLARQDSRMTELRMTLRLYFDTDRSLSTVAAAENISRNTVTYRVQQALKVCGHTLGAPTLKLQAALRIFDWLNAPPGIDDGER